MSKNELDEKLARWRLRIQEFALEVTYRPGIENKVANDLSRLDSWANSTTSVDEEVPTMTISTNPVPFQSDVVDDNEELLLTGEDIADIDALAFEPEVSMSAFL